MNNEQFKRLFPNASRSTLEANHKLSDTEPQYNQEEALGGPAEGEETSLGRTYVRFTGYRVRPLDPDNFAGSIKDLLDGLRHAHLIRGDEPWKIILQTDQIKVKTFAQECTVIEIIWPTASAIDKVNLPREERL